MANQHILVTGGAGFIGSHLVKYHLDKNDSVWVIDDLSSGRRENLPEHTSRLQVDFDDLCQWPKLSEAIAWCDRIYHMAAIVGQKRVVKQPIDTLTSNIKGCERILKELDQSKKQARLLIASTSEVYGHTEYDENGMYNENLMVTPSGKCLQETYPLSKFVNEIMLLAYVKEKNLDCTIARLFNTIGPNQVPYYGMVVPNFIEQALKGIPLTVYGNGQQTRSFVSVHDTCRALDLLLDHPSTKGEIYNVGNEKETTILDLAKLVLARTKSSSEIRFIPYKEIYGFDFQDILKRRPNTQKIRSLTGFKPEWTLEQILDEIIKLKQAVVTV